MAVWSSVIHHKEVCAKTGWSVQTGTRSEGRGIDQSAQCQSYLLFSWTSLNPTFLIISLFWCWRQQDQDLETKWVWPAEQFGHYYIFTHTASETAIGHIQCLPHQMMGTIISIFHNTDTKKAWYHWIFWNYYMLLIKWLLEFWKNVDAFLLLLTCLTSWISHRGLGRVLEGHHTIMQTEELSSIGPCLPLQVLPKV